ncbi:MAG: hypothetical protein HXX08_18280 [Chloroflexi bacterium]|uniref:General stress protein n=1 Tax=Candidatus Chlorohelix allophototropha TaxID=3003348 RepID=A0A8T7M6Q5_9CHLR|nr:hypothetical protein [Chloroflexota bacterium]WJW69710.1 general stress protein [Chloroflexota bacterium L227-S17]
MARTVIGYFNNLGQAERFVKRMLEDNYAPELINLIQKTSDDEKPSFDNTIEAAPVAEYREAIFEADITEEDAEYYQAEVEKGKVIVAAFIPTNPSKGKLSEEKLGNKISDTMRTAGAYDREIRQVFSNRGMTTYPQNRYTDPAALLNSKDRIYRSAISLNQDRSNVLGVSNSETIEPEAGGREVVSGTSLVSQFASAEAELLQKSYDKEAEKLN